MASAGSKKKIIVGETKAVKTADLTTFHKNPRVGNVDEIAKSLFFNGQYRPILVNKGTKTGRSNEVLAGNHTFLAARKGLTWEQNGETYTKEPWDTIYASHVDVDEETAKRIILADNKTAELGTYDDALLAEILADLPDINGIGFDQSEVDDILAQVQADVGAAMGEAAPSMIQGGTVNADDLLAGVSPNDPSNQDPRQRVIAERSPEQREAQQSRGSNVVDFRSDQAVQEMNAPKDVSAELQVVLEAKEQNLWISPNNEWGIADLLPDKLAPMPPNLRTWGGHEATPDDGKTTFVYNYSLGGLKGLPFDRTIVCFYTYDHKFENWWDMPAYYTAKHMAKGIRTAVVPDFSFYYTEPRVRHIWNQYKAQWMGRFFQEAGMKVIPRLQFDYTDPKTLDIALLGVPRNAPVIMCSLQNVENEKKFGPNISAILKDALDELKPQNVVIYGGNPGFRCAKNAGWTGGNMHLLLNYAGERRQSGVFGKQTGAGAMAKADIEALRAKHGVQKGDSVKGPVTEDTELELGEVPEDTIV